MAGPGRILRLEKRGWRRGDLESGCIINWVKGAARLEIEEGGYVETLGSEAVKLGKLVIPDSCHRVDLSEWVNDLEWVLA